MKTSFRISILSVSLFALAAFGFVSNSFAFTYHKIEFKNSDGKVTVVAVDEAGNFDSPNMKAGTYTISWTLVEPPTGSNAAQFGVGRGISSPMAGSAGREASAPSISEVVVSHTITSPRDPASGLPTGKRMHKPFTITKELDKSTPLLATSLGTVTVDTDGSGVKGTVSFKSSAGTPVKASWNLKENTR